MFGKSPTPEKLLANLTPEEIDQANGDPDELAELIVARRGGDHDAVAQALRILFPEQSAPPARADTAAAVEELEEDAEGRVTVHRN